MANKNAYIEAQRVKREEHIWTGWDLATQQMADYIILTLHNPEIMGKDIFSAKRSRRFLVEINRLANLYYKAFTDDVEAEVSQRDLDAELQPICKQYFVPFSQRYPMIKKIDYSRGRKEWRVNHMAEIAELLGMKMGQTYEMAYGKHYAECKLEWDGLYIRYSHGWAKITNGSCFC